MTTESKTPSKAELVAAANAASASAILAAQRAQIAVKAIVPTANAVDLDYQVSIAQVMGQKAEKAAYDLRKALKLLA